MNARISGAGLFLAIFLSCSSLHAQNEDDALRYSKTMFGGTARGIGLAGATGAMGADFSSLSVNPAGLGMFRRSEFTLTPQLLIRGANTQYLGSSRSDEDAALNFQNWGFVFTGKVDNNSTSGWRMVSLGVGYNRLVDFSSRIVASGNNASSSYLDVLRDQSNGSAPQALDAFSTSLAYNSYLTSPFPDSIALNQYFTEMPSLINKSQTRTIQQSGGIGETVISLGGNYSDRLFIGATLGFQRIRFSQINTYSEEDIDQKVPLNYYDEINDLTTDGSGINMKIGAIYMPADFFRFGFALHTPTFMRLTDSYQTSIYAYFDSLGSPKIAESPQGNFDYRLRTPFRFVGSAAFVFNKMGLLSFDYEFVDYRDARLRSGVFSFGQANSNIAVKYQTAGNLRVGTEWKIADFYIRGGYALYGSPFSDNRFGGAMRGITGGFGYRGDGLFVDAGFISSKSSQSQFIYNSMYNGNLMRSDLNSLALVFTVGYKY